MLKIIIGSFVLSASLFAVDLQSDGVEVNYKNSKDEVKTIIIKREKKDECKNVNFDPKAVYGGNGQAADSVDANCKRAFVTYMGKISPIKFSEKVETYGEVEVLDFIAKAKTNKNMMLVDSRTENWFYHETIPSAVNVPYIYMKQSQYPDEFEEYVEILGVKKVDGKYDFSNAKTILMFCNGAWCGQSPESMKALTAIGYPEEKLKWYRGGMQSWLSLGLTTVKP
ncbi:rhodanese-like domain-containing protein [Arcobacter venerupis]|uniref:Rhodanese-like domain-containing protein n=1 Tax=Arcobacter venerupis TaxID=1054033 RepID=A0AAE7B796_9BACT|nr:rhodanese-like domain-containing protein [Arcobacter venerupis]QKF66376.1 rhodanese-like domain-containing protein [Arcobacter venerupis]RWS50847.1 sulfurtransferase [Arcobacter venerupis]